MFLVHERVAPTRIWYNGNSTELARAAQLLAPWPQQLRWFAVRLPQLMTFCLLASIIIGATVISAVRLFGSSASWRIGYGIVAASAAFLLTACVAVMAPFVLRSTVITRFEAALATGQALAMGSLAYSEIEARLRDHDFADLASLDTSYPTLLAEPIAIYAQLCLLHRAGLESADPNEQQYAQTAVRHRATTAAAAIAALVHLVEYDNDRDDAED